MRPLLVVACCLAVLGGCGGDDELSGDLLLTADRVFDGTRVIRDGAVLISGAEVRAAGVRASLDAEARRTIDLGDATILPGIIDLHVHQADELVELKVGSGVTTVRDVGAPIGTLGAPSPARLRVVRAGPIVTAAPNGYPIPVFGPDIALTVSGEEDARQAVARLADRGAGVIKLAVERGRGDLPLLSVVEVRAIVAEAHERGLIATAHVTRPDDAALALAGGVDELAHMPCAAGDPALMRRLAAARIPIVGTLHVEAALGFCSDSLANASTFVAAGGELLYGTDMGNPGIPFTLDVEELRLMTRAGLSVEEALAAATAKAGRQLGLAPLGTLAEGAPADLFAVRGNPFTDLDRLERPALVVVAGEVAFEDGVAVAAGQTGG